MWGSFVASLKWPFKELQFLPLLRRVHFSVLEVAAWCYTALFLKKPQSLNQNVVWLRKFSWVMLCSTFVCHWAPLMWEWGGLMVDRNMRKRPPHSLLAVSKYASMCLHAHVSRFSRNVFLVIFRGGGYLSRENRTTCLTYLPEKPLFLMLWLNL